MFSVQISAQKTYTEKEARAFFETANDTLINTITIFEEDGPLYDLYVNKNPGDIIITGNEMYMVIGTKILSIYNCSAISFNKQEQGAKEVEKLQKTIMAKYKFGTSFEELTTLYSIPENTHEMKISYDEMPDCPFKTALGEHKINEIFVVEISETYSYIMVINSPPIKQKAITVKQAVIL